MYRLLILTPIKHIEGLFEFLSKHFDCVYLPDEELIGILPHLKNCDLIFTNPNKSKIKFDQSFFQETPVLKAIFTASTGEDHIDLEIAMKQGINVYSLKNDRKLINELTSTAELAFLFALVSARKFIPAIQHVKEGGWNYEPFIGRQFSALSIGVIGFGRLGKMFAQYCKAFGASVIVYDPYVEPDSEFVFKKSLTDLANTADIISIHVHHNNETKNMISYDFFEACSGVMSIINTSRGEIVNDAALLSYLKKNQNAMYCTDVLTDEILGRRDNILLKESLGWDQVVITPHIGGMTIEGQFKAYTHTANKLVSKYG